ncbi:hypothetical protein [Actinomycetospora sp.]|uniref:hypothetical protein n=1 Tax=Actinomycetospora sp. TaxID=1872135 RepID=UPI002F417424
MKHTVARLRSDRDEQAARTALLAELDTAGTPAIDQPPYHSATTWLIDMTNTPVPKPDPAEAVDLDPLATADDQDPEDAAADDARRVRRRIRRRGRPRRAR